MESREKMSIFSTDFLGVTPIRGYIQNNSNNYSPRHTRFGDQCAQSRFDALCLQDCTQSVSRDTPSLQLDHLHFPSIKYPVLERELAVKFEPTECSSNGLQVLNEFSELQQGYKAIKLEPDEFPTVNIRDLGSSVLQLSNDDKTCRDSKESDVSRLQYFQNNPQLQLPLQEPLVDMTNALGSLNVIKSPNGSSQNERTYPNRIPIFQHLPVLWKSVFDSSNTKDCSIQELDPIVKGKGALECLTNKIPQLKRSRKLTRPTRSAQRLDPNFRGATVILHTEVKNRNCSLTLSASFSNVKIHKRQVNRKRKNSGSYSNADTVSGSDEENVIPFPRDSYYSGKVCASCGTHRTPLWRDADDGTPLCNACGIRFKKYRIRCSACWHIPKKDIKTYPKCPHCGASLRVSFAKRHPW